MTVCLCNLFRVGGFKLINTCQLKYWRSLVIGNEYFMEGKIQFLENKQENEKSGTCRSLRHWCQHTDFETEKGRKSLNNVNGVPASDVRSEIKLARARTHTHTHQREYNRKSAGCWPIARNLTLSLFRSRDFGALLCEPSQDAWFQFFPYD